MPRKRDIPKKKIIPDPIYKSINVTRLTNMIMQDGKKRTAEKIVYSALTISSKKTKEEPLTVLEKALHNVGPSVEVKSRSSSDFAYPEASVTKTKMEHIVRSIDFLLQGKYSKFDKYRIDVVSIDFSMSPPKIDHIKDVDTSDIPW